MVQNEGVCKCSDERNTDSSEDEETAPDVELDISTDKTRESVSKVGRFGPSLNGNVEP